MAHLAISLSIILSLLSLPSHQITLNPTPTISAAPAVLPDPPPPSYAELSPDISPLFPSPGGAAQAPEGLTIPSTRSPDPDTIDSVGPDTAVAPAGSAMESGAVCGGGAFSGGVLAFWLVAPFMM